MSGGGRRAEADEAAKPVRVQWGGLAGILARDGWARWLAGIGLAAAVGLIGLAVVLVRPGASESHAELDSAAAASYGGTALDGPAPEFTLRDHRGAEVSLANFRGKVVILAFFDSRCVETCPLTAYEFRLANRALSVAAEDVVFLAVNVNPNFNSVRDVAQFTRDKQLDEIPSWHFLTGSAVDVGAVVQRWGIFVGAQAQAGREDFEHTPGVFIIDQAGQRRWYVSVPLIQVGLVAPWDGPPLHELLVRHVNDLLRVPPT